MEGSKNFIRNILNEGSVGAWQACIRGVTAPGLCLAQDIH